MEPVNKDASAQFEIRNILARLAHATDTGTLDEYLDCFTDDAVLERAGQPTARGRAELEARAQALRAAGTLGPGSGVRHALTTISISADGRTATSRAVWLLLRAGDAGLALANFGEYRDVLHLDGGEWKISHRVLHAGA